MNQISRLIYQRNTTLNSNIEPNNSVRFDVVNSMIKEGKDISDISNRYINESFGKNQIKNNYLNIIKILENTDNKYVIDNAKKAILYMEDLSVLAADIKSSNIEESVKEDFIDYIDKIDIADRIIANHNNLSKNFNETVNQNIKNIRIKGVKPLVNSLCELLENYNIKEYQKMNVVIEESLYLTVPYIDIIKESDITKAALEYYSYNTDANIDDLNRVVEASNVLEDKDVKIDTKESEDIDSIDKIINNFVNNKDYDNLHHIVYHGVSATSIEDLLYNLPKLIEFFNNIYSYDHNINIAESFKAMASAIVERSDLDRNNLQDILDSISSLSDSLKHTIIGQYVDIFIDALNVSINSHYTEENIKAIQFVNDNNDQVVSLNEFRNFKFNNILVAIKNIGNILRVREKPFLKKIKNKFTPFKNHLTKLLFGESSNIRDNLYGFIGSDNKVDVCVAQYMTEEFNSEKDMNDFLISVTKEINDKLNLDSNMSSIRSYYTVLEGIAEIHIKDATVIELTEEELYEVQQAFDPAMEFYMELFDYSNDIYNKYKDSKFDSVNNYIERAKTCNNLTQEHFELALEAMKYLPVTKEDVEKLAAITSDSVVESVLIETETHQPLEVIKSIDESINSIVEEWEPYEDVPVSIAMEAYELLLSVFENAGLDITEGVSIKEAMSDDWDDEDEEDDDTDEDEEKDEEEKKDSKDEKKPSDILGKDVDLPEDDYKVRTSSSLTNIKLAIKGLYTKFKDFNTKQKELARNLDHSIRSLVKGIKDARSNERREQIIKGSIIPSFSKCIRFGVLLLGLGIATGGIVAPVIAAIGGFALDKKLTKKEKLLLLDEIDTELEVIDKELALADQNNQLNKYRALLKYKKDLQRQYQRIRYNVRAGSDGSMFAAGVGMQQTD